MIAIFLVGLCVLPLAQFPMQAIAEEMKSAYRMEVPRLADLAFANVKERLYRQEISWEEITLPRERKGVVLDDIVEISFEPLGLKKMKRQAMLYSVGKKGPKGEEWRLVTVQIKFSPIEKKLKLFRGKKKPQRSCVFTYQVLVMRNFLTTTLIFPESAIKINGS